MRRFYKNATVLSDEKGLVVISNKKGSAGYSNRLQIITCSFVWYKLPTRNNVSFI